jgi:hypothetical protein
MAFGVLWFVVLTIGGPSGSGGGIPPLAGHRPKVSPAGLA